LKKNHHYVPQFWLKAFADSNGNIYAWDGRSVGVRSSKRLMKEDWLYTLFDNAWIPTDALEDELSIMEANAAALFSKIAGSSHQFTEQDRQELLSFLALQACRHPDVMNRGYRRTRDLGRLFASVHTFENQLSFAAKAAQFGLTTSISIAYYQSLISISQLQLDKELQECIGLSPQDARLPQQDALQAKSIIASQIDAMSLTVLDAPAGKQFILGDTPLPQADLLAGFSVPLSKNIAVRAQPALKRQIRIERQMATLQDVSEINQVQWDNSLHFVIGPEPSILRALSM
jgi:hypothetical protein